MADNLREHVLVWVDVMRQAEAGPGVRIACPFCTVGEIAVRDISSRADPTRGERLFRCTCCGRSTEARISFGTVGPLFPPAEREEDKPDPRAALDFADRAQGLLRDQSEKIKQS